MGIRSIVSVFVILGLAGCGADQPAGAPGETPTPTPTPTVQPTPSPTPTPDLCSGTTSFEAPSAPDAGASFIMVSFGETVDGFRIDSGSIDVVGTYWEAACGTQSIDLSGGEPAVIHREIATTDGASYRIAFMFAGNPYDSTEVKLVRVYWDAALVDELNIVTDGAGPEDMGWKHYDYDVTASGATSVLRFESLTPGVYGPALDAIQVSELGVAALARPDGHPSERTHRE